jgi:acetolactate synthase small subunit
MITLNQKENNLIIVMKVTMFQKETIVEMKIYQWKIKRTAVDLDQVKRIINLKSKWMPLDENKKKRE